MTTQEDEINQLISDSLNPSSSEDETNYANLVLTYTKREEIGGMSSLY